MKQNLGTLLKSLAQVLFLLIIVIVFLFVITNMDYNNSGLYFGIFIGVIVGSFFMFLPMYIAGEIVDTLHESVDALHEILYKLDNWKNE